MNFCFELRTTAHTNGTKQAASDQPSINIGMFIGVAQAKKYNGNEQLLQFMWGLKEQLSHFPKNHITVWLKIQSCHKFQKFGPCSYVLLKMYNLTFPLNLILNNNLSILSQPMNFYEFIHTFWKKLTSGLSTESFLAFCDFQYTQNFLTVSLTFYLITVEQQTKRKHGLMVENK